MRPIILKGHERPITFLQFSREGDLLFSSSRDKFVNVWYTDNGERLGTFEGHNGAVLCVDVSYDSSRLITASADETAKIWDVKTGRDLFTIKHGVTLRTCAFALGEKQFFTVTDNRMGKQAKINIFNLHNSFFDSDFPDINKQETQPTAEISYKNKILHAVWGPLNKTIICCCDDGSIRSYDAETQRLITVNNDHNKQVNKITLSQDKTMFVSSSNDFTAKLIDSTTLKTLKTYKTEKPVNSASISSLKNHVLLGGGQEASLVTTTAAQTGKFEVRLFNTVFEQEIGTIKGHFGPINAVEFTPDGKGFASGGEDGYIRLHHFDNDYFKIKDDLN